MWLLPNIQHTFAVQDTNSIKNVFSLPDENTQCLVLLYYWKKSVLFSGTEGNEIFYTKPVYYDELFMP